MGRKKKIETLSSSDGRFTVTTLKLEKQIDNAPVTKCRNGKWVNFGKDNKYPYHMLDLYNTSPTLRACINFCVQGVCGGGIDYEAMGIDGSQIRPNWAMSWDEFIRRLALDYWLYGSYAFQILKNRDGKTYSFYPTPIDTLRCAERDEDGDITTWYIAQDWTKTGSTLPIEIDSFIMRPDDEIKIDMGKPYIYVYETYNPSCTYYYQPCWASAIKSVQAEAEFLAYDLRQATNSFVPSGILQMPYCDTDEQKRAIVEEINRMFVGSDNANSLMVVFKNDSEDNPVKYEPLRASTDNVDLFAESDYRNSTRILSAFGLPSRNLIGLEERNTGFSSQGQMLETAYNLWMTLTGRYARQAIIGTINELFKMNGIDTEITVKEINFLGDEKEQVNDANEAPETTQDITEDNIEEQEV